MAAHLKLVILDRDGVINQDSDAYIKSPDEWQPIAGSLEAIARLKAAGYVVAVATNQSGIGRGLFDYTALAAIQAKMAGMLATYGAVFDGVFFCPHTPEDGCACRKPATGLLDDIVEQFGVVLAGAPVIGDSARDIEAACAAGAQPMLVLTGKGRRADKEVAAAVPRFADLAAAVDAILQP